MKIKLSKILLIILAVLGLVFPNLPLSQTGVEVLASESEIIQEPLFEEPELPGEPSLPGRIEGTGKYFEIKDSEYLNITLESSEEIKVVLESIPRMISLNIEASPSSNSTILILEGLEPNKTYYKYQDSYKNEAIFISDDNGSYSWTQDLTESHHIWFQEIKSTVFLPEDCETYGTWNSETSTCVLNQNLTESVEITANDITLDCNGHSITGKETGYGIYLKTKTDVTIKNCVIKDFSYGINLYNRSTNNKIIGNNILDNYYGIFVEYSPENYFRNNSTINNKYNFGIKGSIWELGVLEYIQDIDTSNTVDGRPIYYLVNEENKIIDASTNAGFIGVVNSKNITVRDLMIEKNIQGVLFAYTTDSTIENVTASNNQYGLFLYSSSNNNIVENNVSNNKEGIVLNHSSLNNNIVGNNISNNKWSSGVRIVDFSDNNIITENNILNNGYGIILACGWCWTSNNTITANNVSNNFDSGITLVNSTNNNITANKISNNGFNGISLGPDSSNNNIAENTVLSNGHSGIYISGTGAYTYGWGDHSSKNNKIIGNNILNNSDGISLKDYAPENYFRDNSLEGNKYSFIIDGYNPGWGYAGYYNSRHYIQDIDISNTINGKPIYYLINEQDKVIDVTSNAGFVGVINSANIIIKDLTLGNNWEGVLFFNVTNSIIENVSVSNNNIGIGLHSSSGNDLTINNASGNGTGIFLRYSSGNNIAGSTLSNNEGMGISLSSSSNNIITENQILNNNQYGLFRGGSYYDGQSNNNKVYHNNFVDNEKKPQVGGNWPYYGTGNLFDDGYPSSGNYWSDYIGLDSDGDGIGDTSYTFPGGEDRYPFMQESGWEGSPPPPPEEDEEWSFDVAVILAEPSDVSHESSSITVQPCKLLPEKTYPNGHNKEYFEDLLYCVADYHKENSFGAVNLNFTIYDNDGEWYKTSKNEKDYYLMSKVEEGKGEQEFVKDAINLATNDGINLSNQDIVIVVHSGTSAQREKQKLSTQTWTPDDQPFDFPPYKIIVAEDDLVGGWSHEIGHILGALTTPENTIIPDLYKMGNVGKWGLMARGSWNESGNNPPYMSSYTKEFLGWLNYNIYPKSAYGEYWINSLETNEFEDTVLRYNLSDDTTDESPKYYILETRNRTLKTWDSSLPKEKALVLYYVDTKGYPEYGYASDGIMNNQHRKINIPYFDGILTPNGDSHLDMNNLIYISALSDEHTVDVYKIKTKIEKVDYSFFEDRFKGIILEPASDLYEKIIQYLPFNSSLQRLSQVNTGQLSFQENKIGNTFERKSLTETEKVILYLKYSKNLFTLKSIEFDYEYDKTFREQGGLIGTFSPERERTAMIKEKSIFLLLIVLLNLLIIGINKKIISYWKSEKKKKAVKTILRIVQIISVVPMIIVLFHLILLLASFFVQASTNDLRVISANNLETVPASSVEPATLPDLDLHLYCDDGRHIGMNYGTGEYEVQILGAIVSGDNQDAPEWIFVPKDIKGCHYVVSSYDNQRFLEENPEVAQEIEDFTDSYEIYARYIDPTTAIYTSVVISEDIEPGIKLEHKISGTAQNIAIGQGILIADVDFDPDTLNLKTKDQWVTVYIELPIGHGYDVNMIDIASIELNGEIKTEVKPTGVGDYDNDGISDLMVKFDRSAIQKILSVGEKIKITISGKLLDDRLFEGNDIIRVIRSE